MRGVVEMKITHEGMLEIIDYWLYMRLEDNSQPIPNAQKITQNSHTGEFTIRFEAEDKVKSILPPLLQEQVE